MISILVNPLRFVLWPRTRSVLAGVPQALENVYILLLLGKMLFICEPDPISY